MPLSSVRFESAVLWALVFVCVGFALADRSLLGFDPATLSMLGAVFAASTAAVSARTGSCPRE